MPDPYQNTDVMPQRDAITQALMNISNPPPQTPPLGRGRLPQLPQRLPTNVSGGLTAIGNAIGDMRQPQAPVVPGPPMSLAPPTPMAQPPMAQPPLPQGAPVGAAAPAMPQDPMLQGTGSLY
jgi:hypothetical protein